MCLPLALFALSAASLLTASVSAAAADDIIYRQAVNDASGAPLDVINIRRGEEPADAVYDFGLRHGLDKGHREEILDRICRNVECSRRRAVLWENDVAAGDEDDDSSVVGTFRLYEGAEPADQAHEFVVQHGLPVEYRNAILGAACEIVECHRAEPVIWRKRVNIPGKVVEVEVKEGEEPADVIFSTLHPHNVLYPGRRKVMEMAMQNGVPYTREHALVYSRDVRGENETLVGTLQMFDDGKEPVDKMYHFAIENNASHLFDQMCQAILPELCRLVGCSRHVPVILVQALTTEEGTPFGTLEVLKDEEPIDALDRFIQFAGLHKVYGNDIVVYRDNVLRSLCEKVTCTRTQPVVYRKEITGDAGASLGSVEIYEGEEVVDAVVRFLKETKAPLDGIAIKNHFFKDACPHPRVRCTRNIAVVFDRNMNRNGGDPIGRLLIMENQEPADVIYEWAKTHGLDEDFMFGAINSVCKILLDDGVKCNREAPIVKSFPMNGPDGPVGMFQLKLREEPADAVYAFFAKHGLFEKSWDMRAVISQVCDMPDITCNRMRAVKYFDANYTMGNITVGQLLIMEGQEVIDVLYEKRIKYNLTLEDQMASFTDICKQESVYCERTKAIVYKLGGITKNDFERFGNETCSRKYASFQYLASFTRFKVAGKIGKFLQKDAVTNTLEHPLFGPFMLFAILVCQALILRHISKQRRVYPGQKFVIYSYTFMFVSFVYVSLIMPAGDMDALIHVHDNACPDLEIFEGEEPADAVMRWAKEAAKEHHPVVREKVHWELLDKACEEAEGAQCTRRRAWEPIDMGHLTLFGQQHKIEFMSPWVDPVARRRCVPVMDGRADACLEESAKSFCRRLQPQPPGCIQDISVHMADQFKKYEESRVHSKKPYIRLGLEFDVPAEEIMGKVATYIRSRGMNMAPFSRIDNGTRTYPQWDEHSEEAWKAMDTFQKLKDPETREWTDKPCKELFGGALCAKHDKDGNMIIEV